MPAPPATGARFAAGLVIGFVFGVAVGAAGATLAQPHTPWVDAGGVWARLPSQAIAGPLPQTFTTPAKAWDYGASTRALPATVTAKAPVIIRVDLADISGPVGVSLAKPDGSALISKEAAAPDGAAASLYFRQAVPADIAVLVRNHGVEGQAGSVTVKSVRFAPEASLTAKDMAAVDKAGVN